MHITLDEFGTGPVVFNRYNHAQAMCTLHTHNFIEISYIEDGVGIHTIGNHTYTIYKGDICLINTLTPHKLEAKIGYELRVINCLIDYEHLLNVMALPVVSSSIKNLLCAKQYDYDTDKKMKHRDTSRVHIIMNLMGQDFDEGRTQRVAMYLPLLLSEIDSAVHEKTIADSRKKLAQSISTYLQQHYDKVITLAVLAKQFGYSDKYIARTFKEVMGFSIISYLQRIRIEHAMKLLISTDYTVVDIAHDVGYQDVSFFYQLFSKQTGQLPGKYRTLCKCSNLT